MTDTRAPRGTRDLFAPVRTGISAAYWFDPARFAYEPALLDTMTRSSSGQTAWFDELFEGGIEIPAAGTDTPLTILLTGEPGTGKSTLALELCYRLAYPDAQIGRTQPPLRSVYLTTEGHVEWTIKHARQFNWDPERTVFGEATAAPVQIRPLKSPQDLKAFVSGVGGSKPLLDRASEFFREFPPPSKQRFGPDGRSDPHLTARELVVLDNLNAVTPDPRSWFPFVAELSQTGFRVFILVLDTEHSGVEGGTAAKAWSYLADVVIHLSRQYPVGYMIRTIEILKARYQRHVYGQQQMKIINGGNPSRKGSAREHPYRTEGGIFIFPSMHLALSRRKRIQSPPPDRLRTPYPPLDDLLSGGFLTRRCVALAGSRGTHKSRLAFAQVLKTLRDDRDSRALIISLHEEEAAVLQELSDIDLCGRIAPGEPARSDFVCNAVAEGRLELSYYPPGFIAPEEFFHRVQLSIARQKKAAGRGHVLLVFNSLDLLHSHFPLCAKHRIFVPALVELLCLEGVTSFFISTTRGGHDPYGLMSMADPVLRFARVSADHDFLVRRVFQPEHASAVGGAETIVHMTVERFAAGVSAGAGVFLALIDAKHPLVACHGMRNGLHCFRDKALDAAVT
jgi:KaiC/GvpD/RAD55 family RecA-like ATPase